ncbi:DUF5817 domain-containing protein [Haloarchaeobius sp. HME9146]|uniref:DUF5817 family protein n=1 Tax=Haloarchaeobius sp. HME9146 TaxID=2978732 RepID=UPI0021BE8103|nr:DUF5817 domain-containing protein [Haloarchaeobius sp. HME9146]MCT9097778.1 DUF5817 domain-containing protein [Haloarchaeobius sp. HME9146]
MYHVVGCSDCGALRIIEDRPESTQCGRCGTRRKFKQVRSFVTTDDLDHAREVRASMLANRQGEGEAFAKVESFAELDDAVADGVIDDAEFLEASGLDVDEVNAAGDRASGGGSRSLSRKETVEAALRELDRPTEDEVVAFAEEHGVPADYVERALQKLVRRGEVSESRGRYRRL